MYNYQKYNLILKNIGVVVYRSYCHRELPPLYIYLTGCRIARGVARDVVDIHGIT